MRVEDDIVRPAQLAVAGTAIEHLDRASRQVDPLDPAAAIVLGLEDPPPLAALLGPFDAGTVAEITLSGLSACRTDRGRARRGEDMLRSDQRRGRQACVRTCRSPGAPLN